MGCANSKERDAEIEHCRRVQEDQLKELEDLKALAKDLESQLVHEQEKCIELEEQFDIKSRAYELEQMQRDESRQIEQRHLSELDRELEKVSRERAYLERQVEEKTASIGKVKSHMNTFHAIVDAVENEAKRMEQDFVIPAQVQLLVELWEERMTLKGKHSSRRPPRFLGEQWFPPMMTIAAQSEVEMFLSSHPLLCGRPHDQKPTLDSRVETNNTFVNTRIMFDSEYAEDREKREGKIYFSARSAMKTIFREDEDLPDEKDLPQNIVLKVWERRSEPGCTIAQSQWNLTYQSHPCPCNIEYDDEDRKSIRRSVADIQLDNDNGTETKVFEGGADSSIVILFHEADCFEVTFPLPQTEQDYQDMMNQRIQEMTKKHQTALQQMMESQSQQNLSLKESVEQWQKESNQWQERYKSKEIFLSKKQEELNSLKDELNNAHEEMRKLIAQKAKPQKTMIPTPSCPNSGDENRMRFYSLAVREEDAVLFENDVIGVYMTQYFPFQNENLLMKAAKDRRLEGTVELRVYVHGSKMGFEAINLKCTNHDVSGLKVLPDPITSAERNLDDDEEKAPRIILQTINLELVELVQSNPWVKAEMTLVPLYADEDAPGIEHTCEFAIPVLLSKFFVPLDSNENFHGLWNGPMHDVPQQCVVVAKTRPTRDVAWMLSLGGAFRHFDHAENGPWSLGGRLLPHGAMEGEYICLIQVDSFTDMWKVVVKCPEIRIAETIAAILEAVLTTCPQKKLKEHRLTELGY